MCAKYRHHGYQDDDREERPQSQGERPPRADRIEGQPRGRSSSGPGAAVFRCSACNHRITVHGAPVATDATCEKCQKPLHCCSNCRHFDTASLFECRRKIPARVESKTKANECEHFEPKSVADLKSPRGQSSAPRPDSARAAFDALFKK